MMAEISEGPSGSAVERPARGNDGPHVLQPDVPLDVLCELDRVTYPPQKDAKVSLLSLLDIHSRSLEPHR